MIVDDDPSSSLLVEKYLDSGGFITFSFDNPALALEEFKNSRFDMVITDIQMKSFNGFELLEHLRQVNADIPVVMMTDSEDTQLAIRAIRAGANDYLLKPISKTLLLNTIERLLQHARLQNTNRQYMQKLREREQYLNRQLRLARKIHRAIIPNQLPSSDKVTFSLCYEPCDEIGGDFIHVRRPGNQDLIGVLLADISGHGIPAALLAAMLKNIVAEIDAVSPGMHEFMIEFDNRVSKNFPFGQFIAASYLEFDLKNNQLNYIQANIEPFFIVHTNGEVDEILSGKGLIGLSHLHKNDPRFPVFSTSLKKGDLVLAHSDGLTEAWNKSGKSILGAKELKKWLPKLAGMSAVDALNSVHGELINFAGASDFEDDLTILVAEIK